MKTQLFLLLATTMLSAPSPARAQVMEDGPPVVLSPGDIVKISVWRHPELTGDFVVGSDGMLVHPLYRIVRVAGTPLPQVEASVRQFLTGYDANPAFSLSALLHVYVAGQVRAPGILTVAPGATISQAIALAGGVTDDADVHDIRLIRGSEMIPVDLTDPTTPIGRTTMRSGDQIVVKKGTSVFRDRIAPMASVISAVAGLVSVIAVLTTRK